MSTPYQPASKAEELAEAYLAGRRDELKKNRFSLNLTRTSLLVQLFVVVAMAWTNEQLHRTVKELAAYLKTGGIPDIVQAQEQMKALDQNVEAMKKVCGTR